MDNHLPGLYDPTKTKIPKRYRKRMPSLKHLKTNPCTSFWQELVNCYSLHNFQAENCIPPLLAYEECKKNMKPVKVRMSAARFYIRTVFKQVSEASKRK